MSTQQRDYNIRITRMRMRGALYRVKYVTILHSSPLKIGGQSNEKKLQETNVTSYNTSLSGGFLIRVDFLTGAVSGTLGSVWSFDTVDGKI